MGIADPGLTVRRITIAANHVLPESVVEARPVQLSLFDSPEAQEARAEEQQKEKKKQQAILEIRKKYGKNAIVKGMNLQEAGTAMDRNQQVGGHKA